ncbi:MAG: glycosyltransferase family 4 protein [Pseudohaliea sp.]
MKKIAIDARFLTRKQRGMPAYVSKLCSMIPKQMPDVKFYLLINKTYEHNDNEENYNPRLEALSSIGNVVIQNIESDGEQLWELYKLPRFLRKARIDVLHMPTNRVCMLTSKKQITTVHDCMELKYIKKNHGIPKTGSLKKKFYHWRKQVYIKLNYRYGVARKANRIITVSHHSRESISDLLKVKASHITVCRHGMPDGYDANTRKPLALRNGVLMLGGESFQKNCEASVAAYAQLDESTRQTHKLTICGFTQQQDSLILRTIKRYGIEDDVELLGWVSTEKLASYFSSCRAFLFVSREEGFGFPLLQALHLGTPTVISDADVLTEVAGDTYPCAPVDCVNSMSELLRAYLNDDGLWKKISAQSIDASQRFSWNESIKTHIEVYRSLL